MHVLLWVLQIVLALQAFAGGAYKVFQFDKLENAPTTKALPRAAWNAIGVLEMVCGVLLVVPAATGWMPMLTPLGAVVLAVESFALAALYARHSLKIAATNPLVYVVFSGVLAAFVAYGRYALAPVT
jgi:hypothetical protein